MSSTYQAFFKSIPEFKVLNYINTVLEVIVSLILVIVMFTSFGKSGVLDLLVIILMINMIESTVIIKYYFLSLPQLEGRKSLFNKIRELSAKNTKIPKPQFLFLVLFHLSYIAMIIDPFNILFWFTKNALLAILLLSLLLFSSTRSNLPKSRLLYPTAVILIISVGSIMLNVLIYLYLQHTIVLPGFYFVLCYPLIILDVIMMGIVILLENEKEKYFEFSEYERSFEGLSKDFSDHSFTGFIASVPSKLARSKYYLNINTACSVVLGVYLYVEFLIYSNTRWSIVEIVKFAILVIVFFIITSGQIESRREISGMMSKYSKVMNSFNESNQELFAFLDQPEE